MKKYASNSVVVCIDLSCKELHRQVGVGIVVTSGSFLCVMVNAKDVGSIPTQGAMFRIFITPTSLVAMPTIMYKICTVWLLNLPCTYVCEVTVCMYVIVSIKRLTIPGGRVY